MTHHLQFCRLATNERLDSVKAYNWATNLADVARGRVVQSELRLVPRNSPKKVAVTESTCPATSILTHIEAITPNPYHIAKYQENQ